MTKIATVKKNPNQQYVVFDGDFGDYETGDWETMVYYINNRLEDGGSPIDRFVVYELGKEINLKIEQNITIEMI